MNKYNIGDKVNFEYHGKIFKDYKISIIWGREWEAKGITIAYTVKKDLVGEFSSQIREVDIFTTRNKPKIKEEKENGQGKD